MKQTAVEWLEKAILLYVERCDLHKEFEQAKQMEKEQIKDAWFDGVTNWDSEKEVKDYINETFKSDNGCACYGSNSMHKCNCK